MEGAPSYAQMRVAGVSLEYRYLRAAADAPTLVLLHEGLGCVALWRDLPERLVVKTGCSVFAYSRAGYGGSDPIELPRPLSYMSDEAQHVLPFVLAHANVENYSLVGHSDGATIALAYAARSTDPGLNSVVVLAPHVFIEACAIEAISRIRDEYSESYLRDRLSKYHRSNVDCAFYGWCDSWLNPKFLEWSIESDLADISIPILQIQGRDDQYGTEEQLRRIERGVSSEVQTVLLEECGHSPHQEQPQLFLEAIADFIDRG